MNESRLESNTMWLLGLVCLSLVLQGRSKQIDVIVEQAPHFICTDGSKIALANVCDGLPQCWDSSDETRKLCYDLDCPSTSFRCDYGACITWEARCNGFIDCLDGSDEIFCDEENDCDNQEFSCYNSSECISSSLICNGFEDCADGSDESSIVCNNNFCPEHKYQCSYGGCIHREVICNGFDDCIDGSDETVELCIAENCNGTDCQEFNCKDDEFSCKNRNQCVPKYRVCDGTRQCWDASDESSEICHNHTCTEGQFHCYYGGCANASLQCNGRPDCYDWSDETDDLCGETSLPDGACRLPPARSGTSYTVSKSCGDCRPGDITPELTTLEFSCFGNASLEGFSTVHCQDNRWLPSLPICYSADDAITCPPVSSAGTIKSCEVKSGVNAGWRSCDESQPIGTEMTLECLEYHEREHGLKHITCLHDGTWSQVPLSCHPICGIRIQNTAVPLIVRGWDIPIEEPLPWQATLFERDHKRGGWSFFCGGTLITDRVVLTAGHCVWKMKDKPETIKVLLASNSSDFQTQDEKVQVGDVETIKIQNSYQDYEGNYNSDLALLILRKPISINSNVLPACIDWTNENDIMHRKGEIALVAGMGMTENNTVSSSLRAVSAQIVDSEMCRKRMTREFRKYISYTSFCAGWANGSSACNGDSGGGLLLPQPGRPDVWEVHGVVSLSPRRPASTLCNPKSFSVLTRISAYLGWIKEVLHSTSLKKERDSISRKLEFSQQQLDGN